MKQKKMIFVALLLHSGAIIYSAAAPVVQAAAPVVQAAAPVVQAAAPVVQAAAPVVQAAAPVVQAAAPVVQAAAPVVQAAAPVVQAAAPVVQAAARVVQAAAPVVQAAAPGVQAAAPVVQAAAPVVQAAAPVVGGKGKKGKVVVEVGAAAPVVQAAAQVALPDLRDLAQSEIDMQMSAITALLEQNPTFIEEHINRVQEQQVERAITNSADAESQKFLGSTEGRSKVVRVLKNYCMLLQKEEEDSKPSLYKMFDFIGSGINGEISRRSNKNIKAIELIVDAASNGYVRINFADLLELFREIKQIKNENIRNLDKESIDIIEKMNIVLTELFHSESEHIARLKKIQKQISVLCKAANADPENTSDDEGDGSRNWSSVEIFNALQISEGPLPSGAFQLRCECAPVPNFASLKHNMPISPN